MKRLTQITARIVLVLAFGASGLAKLLAPAMFAEMFAHLELPLWFILVTGSVEILGAALIASFKESPSRLGAGLLAATMAVATALHLVHDPAPMALPATALLLLAAWVALDPLRKRPMVQIADA